MASVFNRIVDFATYIIICSQNQSCSKIDSRPGFLLAGALAKYQNKDVVLFSLPRGGMAVGAEISGNLKFPHDIVVVRKIGHPFNPEYAIAAVSESGYLVANEKETFRVDESWLEKAVEDERLETERRRREYSEKKLPATIKGKIAIIADDGLVTGLTIKASIKEIRALQPKKLIVAVPVAPEETCRNLEKVADKVIVTKRDKSFRGSIGAYYRNFPQLTDKEVISILGEK